MTTDLQIVYPTNHTIPHKAIVLSSTKSQIDTDWLNYFSIDMAIKTTFAHIATLPGTKNTPEKHTMRAYSSGLFYFLDWIEDRLPTLELMTEFVAHLSTKQNHKTKSYGLSASTIASKYLAPIRIYLKSLSNQHIIGDVYTTPKIVSYREAIRSALTIKNPKPDVKSNLSPLLRYGTRLTKRQVNKLLRDVDRSTVVGKRDYALLMTAFNTGLRLAELSRITLASITENDDDCYTVQVRGKRNNYDPVSIADSAVDAINDYVISYNAGLAVDDIRRIESNTPLWQSMTRSGNYLSIKHRTGCSHHYKPQNGMSTSGITGIISRHTNIRPHDVRRTFATLAYNARMPIFDLSRQMRHSSVATTERYIGVEPDYKKSNLASYLTLG